MLAWMLYVIMVTLLLSVGAFVAERAARLRRVGTRWIWITTIIASLALPTLIASVSVQLPNVMAPAVAQKMVALRDVTTQALSPVFWISGSAAEPLGWRDFDVLLKTLWGAASVAMLLALLASGIHLMIRKRHWRRGTLSGATVLITDDVGPAVVGLARPCIVVPRWVTLALPSQQSAVIAHEQSHLEARDPQLFTLALALLVFMPWNLPLWWQLRRLRYAIEIDCDARVLKGGVDLAHYGETLIVVGERQSAYIGAVAAMSESKSFLEERIEHMSKKPVRWRRLGVATLASFAIALTALAAQVSPPNAETAAPAAVEAGKKERKEIQLPEGTLARYVGTYKFDGAQVFTISRNGAGLQAQMTGQPPVDLYAESETNFFLKVVDAQIDFITEGGAQATALTMHQGGIDITMPRIDAGTVEQIRIDLAARIASGSPAPGSEAAVRKFTAAASAGKPNYEDMSPAIAKAVRDQAPQMEPMMKMMGAIQSVDFIKVGEGGWDVYRVKYANGTLLWRIGLGPDGKVNYALVLPDA